MEGARSGETEIQDQPDDENWSAKDRKKRDGNDWNHDLWNIAGRLSVTEVIEGIQVLIVVAYRETEVFLLLFSDRLLNFTRRGRSR